MRVKKEHEHIRTTISLEKGLVELFNKHYPDINLSFLIECILKEALLLKGIDYTLAEEEILEQKAMKTAKTLKNILKTVTLAKRTFSKEILDRVRIESNIYE